MHDSNNNKALCASVQYYHIPLGDGNNNNNTAATTLYVVNKPLVRRRTSFIFATHCITNGDNNKATTATTNNPCQQQGLKRDKLCIKDLMRKGMSHKPTLCMRRS
jgi:hypothetical protein